MTRFGTSERKRCAAVMGLSATRADLRLAKKALAQQAIMDFLQTRQCFRTENNDLSTRCN
jgi:hypothetical protein